MPTGPKPRATLEAVAAEAGVALSTASKVINGRPGLSDETRARVERAAAELGYAPSGKAAASTPRVVAVFDSLQNPHSLRVLDGLIAAGQASGVEIVAHTIRVTSGPDRVYPLDAAWARETAARGHAGVVAVTTELSSSFLAASRRSRLPVIAIDAPNPLDDTVASVGSTDWMGGYQATTHLIELGHRRIGFVAGDAKNVALRQRLAGYREALETAGIVWDPSIVSETGMTTADESVTRMLAAADRPTGLFACFDGGALTAIRAAEVQGLRVPEDVSVVGYDDAYAGIIASPSLTTIRVPFYDIGEMALDMLTRIRHGGSPPTSHVQLSTSLVVRESTAVVPTVVRPAAADTPS